MFSCCPSRSRAAAPDRPRPIPGSQVHCLEHLEPLYKDISIDSGTEIRLSHGNWKLKPNPRNRSHSAAQHQQAAVAHHTGLFEASLRNRGCTIAPRSFIETIREPHRPRLTVGDLRKQHFALVLVDRAMRQGISADDAFGLVQVARHSLSRDAANLELTVIRAAQWMKNHQVDAPQAWQQTSAAAMQTQAVPPDTTCASDRKGASSAHPKPVMATAQHTSEPGARTFRRRLELSSALGRASELPTSASTRDLARALQADAETPAVTLSRARHYRHIIDIANALDPLAARGDASFTATDANISKFQLLACAEGFLSTAAQRRPVTFSYPDRATEADKVRMITQWATSCRSTQNTKYYPVSAAEVALRSVIHTKQGGVRLPGPSVRRFTTLMHIARHAPQIDRADVRTLTAVLSLIPLSGVTDKSQLDRDFRKLFALAVMHDPETVAPSPKNRPRATTSIACVA